MGTFTNTGIGNHISRAIQTAGLWVIDKASGSVAEPVIFFVDLHYQSSNIGTKNKAPSPTLYN